MLTSNSPIVRGFWDLLPRPFYALAPMADVTDAAYRLLIARLGKPHVMFTEFVSADGLCSPGRENLLHNLIYSPIERPIVAQIFSADPERVHDASRLMADLGFDGIDINMGCPDKNVCRQGAGSSLIRAPKLACELIHAATEGSRLPVSVKTRIGYNAPSVTEWIAALLSASPAAITIHLRTRKDMSRVPARWEYIHDAVALARETGTLIIGNGDVRDIDHADSLAASTGVDGIMIGRAAIGNPWLFDRTRSASGAPLSERISLAIEHAVLFEQMFAGKKNFAIMRKYLRAYFQGFPGSKDLRTRLEHINSATEVRNLLDQFKLPSTTAPSPASST